MSYGILIVVAGPMFAGKSETIIKSISEQNILGYSVKQPIVFKHAWDKTRYDGQYIVSHNHNQTPCQLLDDDGLKSLQAKAKDCDWVFIDEVQFFNKEQLLNCCHALLKSGINICCAGLNQDCFGKPFGAMGELLALADHIITICSKCSTCGAPATKTKRLTEDTATVLVGGSAIYEPRCRAHWL